jgi:DNA-binding NtrC family response regulator
MSESIEKEQSVLIVDDKEQYRRIFEDISQDMGLRAVSATNGLEALRKIDTQLFSLALVDLKMPKMGGLDFLMHSRRISPGLPVIIITGFGSIETAVEAMKLGAVDYITKPSSIDEIRRIMRKILESWRSSLRSSLDDSETGKFGIIGRSKFMQAVYERINAMRHADNTVMILGESGVGKELVAKAIHFFGDKKDEPFIPIDCSVLGLNIVESELFGHAKGAFTDALFEKVGLLKLAGKGTVFLDEITGIPLTIQAKLLRAIQEREIRPVGSTRIEKIEARIIAATNKKLEQAVQDGTFREDLFYRLHVIPISVPPLRERQEDIPLLVKHFIDKHNTERRSVQGVSPEALKILNKYSWPGNVRELENVIQESIALGSSNWLRPIDLPEKIRHTKKTISATSKGVKPLKEMEREAIIEALKLTSGKKKDAARILGIGKTTLYEKIKHYGIKSLTEE